MTYKTIQFFTAKTDDPSVFSVTMLGDSRRSTKLLVHLSGKFDSDILDYIELYGIWAFVCRFELAGQARNAKNLKVIVSRGAIKRLLRETSSKSNLFQYTNAIRTQLFGLEDISVEKDGAWASTVEPTLSVDWDGQPPPYPAVVNEVFGNLIITRHVLDRYHEKTGYEGKPDGIFAKVTKLARSARLEKSLDSSMLNHKVRKYGAEQVNTIYLQSDSDWYFVAVRLSDREYLLKTIYQRGDNWE